MSRRLYTSPAAFTVDRPMPPTPSAPTWNLYCVPRNVSTPVPALPLPMYAACTSSMSTVPSGVLPATALGPRATPLGLPTHPPSSSATAPTSAECRAIDLTPCRIIRCLPLLVFASVPGFMRCAKSSLLTRPRQLDDLAGAEHADLERGPRWRCGQLVANLLDVLVGHRGDAVDREDDVASERQLLPADRDHPFAPGQAHVPRRRVLSHGLDEKSAGRRDVEHRGRVAGEDVALEGGPEHLAVDQELSRVVDRHGKAQALAAPRLRDVLADDADDLARHVEHGATGVPRVDRGR